ncbi:MAG TPA: ATP synthase F1 subunit epsilon [Verrucomicrobiota bacterium]|jgi:F-type H+-transporting ATPase subunit epsilon|nr:ATP synthase F1 subunit epsilon [Verrucomicrobiota bacterium]HPY30586.1 ATP synthase F1 subunit epsilon [Verrucomicrobiota bacterium]HQB17013.1 ATP synthase F1 subunit epsilon [Verrucomicrobiota bacterium]
MATLKLEIITPEAKVFSEDVEMVTLPGVDGELGVYPMHVPLMTQIVPGEIIARKGSAETCLAVGEGFVEITADRVTVLSDMAIEAANIDEAQVAEARRRAEARLAEKLSAEDEALTQATLARTAAQLKVKQRRKQV